MYVCRQKSVCRKKGRERGIRPPARTHNTRKRKRGDRGGWRESRRDDLLVKAAAHDNNTMRRRRRGERDDDRGGRGERGGGRRGGNSANCGKRERIRGACGGVLRRGTSVLGSGDREDEGERGHRTAHANLALSHHGGRAAGCRRTHTNSAKSRQEEREVG